MAVNILYQHAATEESALLFLQRNLLVRSEAPDCGTCGRQLSLVKTGRGDERCFRCPTHKGVKIFLCKDTFFENSQLSYRNIVELIFWWSFKESVGNTVILTGLSEPVVVQWNQYFRDVCSNWLIRNPYMIGGVGRVVEIDECLIAKRKNNAGRVVEQRWVFGGVERDTNKGFLVTVPDRTAQTLLQLVQENIAPGSIIHSDGFASYHNLTAVPVNPPYQHLVVNHNRNFVDPQTGACTNKVECYWKNAKRRFKCMAGVHNSNLDSHLDEFLWREIHGKTPLQAFNNFIDHLAQWYPAP